MPPTIRVGVLTHAEGAHLDAYFGALAKITEVESVVLADPSGRVSRLIARKLTEEQIVEELCPAALGRPSGEKERRIARKLFAAGSQREAAQDFLWALLNSHEFLFIR